MRRLAVILSLWASAALCHPLDEVIEGPRWWNDPQCAFIGEWGVLHNVKMYGQNVVAGTPWPVSDANTYDIWMANETEGAILWRSRMVGMDWEAGSGFPVGSYLSTNYAAAGRLLHEHVEAWSDAIEDLMPYFIDTVYSDQHYDNVRGELVELTGDNIQTMEDGNLNKWVRPDVTFNLWFSNAVPELMRTNFPPRIHKVDYFTNHSIGIVLGTATQTAVGVYRALPVITTNYMHGVIGFENCFTVLDNETNGTAHWTKRLDRPGHNVIGEWMWNGASWDQIRATDYQASEYYLGRTVYPVVADGEGSVSIVWKSGNATGTVPAGLQFNTGGVDYYVVSNGVSKPCLRQSAQTVNWSGVNPSVTLDWPILWMQEDTGASISGVGRPNDRVTMYYPHAYTAYEGTEAWDWVLRSEALNEHRMALRGLAFFQTDQWSWTNCIRHEIGFHSEQHIYSYSGFGTISKTNPPAPEDIKELDGIWYDDCPIVESIIWAGLLSASNGVAESSCGDGPWIEYYIDGSMWFAESLVSDADYCGMSVTSAVPPYPSNNWDWVASVGGEARVDITGTSVSAQMVIGCWSGAPHRVHVYGRWPMAPGVWFERKTVAPADRYGLPMYTILPEVVTTNINMWEDLDDGFLSPSECVESNKTIAAYDDGDEPYVLITSLVFQAETWAEDGNDEGDEFADIPTYTYYCGTNGPYQAYSLSNTVLFTGLWANDAPATSVVVNIYGPTLKCEINVSGCLSNNDPLVWGDCTNEWERKWTTTQLPEEVVTHSVTGMFFERYEVIATNALECTHVVTNSYGSEVLDYMRTNHDLSVSVEDADRINITTGINWRVENWLIRYNGSLDSVNDMRGKWQALTTTNGSWRAEPEFRVLIEYQLHSYGFDQ